MPMKLFTGELLDKMKVLLIGNLTIDHNITESGNYTGAGGSVFFLAKTLENLDCHPYLFTSYGSDFPKENLAQTTYLLKKPLYEKTLIFKNIYKCNNEREQYVENYQEYLRVSLKGLAKLQKEDIDTVIIAPIIDNISTEDITYIHGLFSHKLLVLLPQGVFRSISPTGKVIKKDIDLLQKSFQYFKIICLSEEDIREADTKATIWSNSGTIVIITKGARGSSLYHLGVKIDTPAFNINKIVDSTGAGDIFAAAFSFAYAKSNDLKFASEFANASAGLSLRFAKNKLQYGYKEIIDFAYSQGREIKI